MDRLTLSDERLMTLAAGGDQQAFEALVRRLGSTILTVAHRMLGDSAAADEAFVDAVSKVWLGRGTYQSGLPVRPWLMAIAANVCRERMRRSWRLALHENSDERTDHRSVNEPSPDAALSGEEQSARLSEALCRLPERQREALVLRLWGGLSYRQIAAAMFVPEVTARSLMHHALGAMRRLVGTLAELDGERAASTDDQQTATKHRSAHQ